MLDHPQVVGDEEIGETELLLQIEQHIQNLRLDRHVERGDRLVGTINLAFTRERPGDADALALSAGEFVRISAEIFAAQSDPPSSSRTRALEIAALARP